MIKILSDEKRVAINNAQSPDAKYGDVFKAIAQAQNDYTIRQILNRLNGIYKQAGDLGVLETNLRDYIQELQGEVKK